MTFSEPSNTAVFTTKFVMNDDKEITYVSHDKDDGSWQFLSNDEFEHFGKVIMIVTLGQIIEKDNSLLELGSMPEGYFATRSNKFDKWIIKKQVE